MRSILILLRDLCVSAIVGSAIAAGVYAGLLIDDAGLRAGNSPHSGFTPDCPTWPYPADEKAPAASHDATDAQSKID